MTDPLLTAAARRYVSRMISAIAPHADRLDRRFRAILRQRGYGAAQARTFLAITPAAASRLPSLDQFLEQVEYHGRRLAKFNLDPGEVRETLKAFGPLLDAVLAGRFEPAREQLHLAAVLALNEAFYQVREAEAQAFFGLYRAEAESSGLDDLLRRFVRILTRTFRAGTGRLLLLDRPPRGQLARPLYIERGQAREKLIADPKMRGHCASYWSFPMRPAALLQFGFGGRYPWLPRELTLLNAVAERCQEAIEKVRLEAEIRRLEAEARRAEEEERRRIGRELHDEAAQSLVLLRLQLEMMERDAGAEMRPRLAEARGIAERTVEELRRIVAALSPAVLERLGLEAALRQLAARFRKMHPAAIRVRVSGAWESFPRQSQEVIYRVAQESLQNIAKHSQATRVNLLLRSTDKSIRLSVSDNGAGFAREAALSKPMSFGLAGMRERAALLDGNLAIRSAPGKGVTVVLELPQASAAGTHHGQNSRIVN
jgi:signal transduction histidine kinase